MSTLLEAIEIIAEDVCAHAGALVIEPPGDERDDFDDGDWWRNGPLAGDLLDLAEAVNTAAAIVDRPRVRQYLASADFPKSRRLAEILAQPVLVAAPRPSLPAPARVPGQPSLVDRVLVAMERRGTPLYRTLVAQAIDGAEEWASNQLAKDAGAAMGGNVIRTLGRLERDGWLRLVHAGLPGHGGRPATYRITDKLRAIIAETRGAAE